MRLGVWLSVLAAALGARSAYGYPKCGSWESALVGVSPDGRYAATVLTYSLGGPTLVIRDLAEPRVPDSSTLSPPMLSIGLDEAPPGKRPFEDEPPRLGKLALVHPAAWPSQDALEGRTAILAAVEARCGKEAAKEAGAPHAFASDEPPAELRRVLFGKVYAVLVYRSTAEQCDSEEGDQARSIPCSPEAAEIARSDRQIVSTGDRPTILRRIADEVWRRQADPARALALLSTLRNVASEEEWLAVVSDKTLYLSQLGPVGARACMQLVDVAKTKPELQKVPRVRDAILYNARLCEKKAR